MSEIPPFEEVCNELRVTLGKYRCPEKIVWVAPEHTVMCGHEWGIFDGEFLENSTVKLEYEAYRHDGLYGIKLCLLCVDDSKSYCYMRLPATMIDAEYALLIDRVVKISIPFRIMKSKVLSRGNLRTAWCMARERKYMEMKAAAFGIP